MPKKVILFAPCAFNLAETSRMVEIAKGIKGHSRASQAFDEHFISDSSDFENLIERHGFPRTRLEPRLTPQKIEHIAKSAKAKAAAFSKLIAQWDGPRVAAEKLLERYSGIS